MKSRYSYPLIILTLALGLFAVSPASAQTQLLAVEQDIPMAATLDNPCTAGIEAIAFTGTTHLNQQVWLMPGGTTRLIVSENTTLNGKDTLLGALSPTYTVTASSETDVEFNPGAASLFQYKHVINSAGQDSFHTILQIDFDPSSLRLNLSLQGACGDGSPAP